MAQQYRKPLIPRVIDDYVLKDTISQSPEAVIVKAHHTKLQEDVVFKIVNDRYNPVELSNLCSLEHPNIVKFYEAFRSHGFTYIVLEYLTEEEARTLFLQIVDVVHYLHVEKQFAHRDLKPENILLDDETKTIKLCDFAFGTQICPKFSHQEWLGSVEYCSPEIGKRIPYSGAEVDMWALGVLLYEMLTGSVPFKDLDYSHPLRFPPHFSCECRELISSLLEVDRTKRLTIQQVAQHPWMRIGQEHQHQQEQASLSLPVLIKR